MMITREEALEEANSWLRNRGVEGIEIVNYTQQGDDIAWEINITPSDERFNNLSGELREHMNKWFREVRAGREGG